MTGTAKGRKKLQNLFISKPLLVLYSCYGFDRRGQALNLHRNMYDVHHCPNSAKFR